MKRSLAFLLAMLGLLIPWLFNSTSGSSWTEGAWVLDADLCAREAANLEATQRLLYEEIVCKLQSQRWVFDGHRLSFEEASFSNRTAELDVLVDTDQQFAFGIEGIRYSWFRSGGAAWFSLKSPVQASVFMKRPSNEWGSSPGESLEGAIPNSSSKPLRTGDVFDRVPELSELPSILTCLNCQWADSQSASHTVCKGLPVWFVLEAPEFRTVGRSKSKAEALRSTPSLQGQKIYFGPPCECPKCWPK